MYWASFFPSSPYAGVLKGFPFWPQQLYNLTALLFVGGPLALLPYKITTVQMSLVAVMHTVCSLRTSTQMWTTCVSGSVMKGPM